MWFETPSALRYDVFRYHQQRGVWERFEFKDLNRGDIFRIYYSNHPLLSSPVANVAMNAPMKNTPYGYGCSSNVISGNVVFANANLVPWTVANTPVSTTASAGTSSTTLTVASASGVSQGQGVADSTNNARILAGTYVTNISGTTITLSQAANGVLSGDTIRFSQFSDGEGILFDDTAGDQGGGTGVIYAGKSLVSNNVCLFNGSSGIQIFDSANVDVIFNTCFKNMQHPAYAAFFTYGDIYYSSNGANRSCSGICANNIVQVTGSVSAIALNASGGGSVSGVTASNNLSFGDPTALPGTNNVTNQDPLFVSLPATTVTFLTTSGATISNGHLSNPSQRFNHGCEWEYLDHCQRCCG